ncbi:hypothetical protein ACFFQF_07230 [Haladaptatus pallidirubidus]|uniref:DUF7573 domain-containing protein n=1 Tax=Haladaptatus pallidirubidus TaxID=1008152 RepID=A0AAV3UMD1_9EURY|nr:hypothetical protein [Haladaptatus pallidirubidus]
MSRDTSLADFGTSEGDAEAESEGEESPVEAESRTEIGEQENAEVESGVEAESEREPRSDSIGEAESSADSDADIEPALATYDWTPGGVACECCGESVERRWRDEDEMVCANCKKW